MNSSTEETAAFIHTARKVVETLRAQGYAALAVELMEKTDALSASPTPTAPVDDAGARERLEAWATDYERRSANWEGGGARVHAAILRQKAADLRWALTRLQQTEGRGT